jgi:hypothetical protein
MKRTTVSILVLALAIGALVAPAAEAKKKKPKKPPVVAAVPAEQKYFLHWDDDGAGGCTGTQNMSLDEHPGTTCNSSTQPAQEVFAAAGQDLIVNLFPAVDGVPFTVDASRKMTGEIVLRGTITAQAYAQLTLTGVVDGAEVILAEGETAKANGAASNSVSQGAPVNVRQDLPGPAAVLPVDVELDKAYDLKQVTGVTLTVTIRGMHRGGIDYDRTPSHIIIPTFI